MLNINHLRSVIKRVLKAMGEYTPEGELLILGTFAMESKLSDLHSGGKFGDLNYKYGLMAMDAKKLDWILTEWLPYSRQYIDKLELAVGLYLTDLEPNDIRHLADEHIGFMVALTHSWYRTHYEDVPEMDYLEIAKCYKSEWDTEFGTRTVDEFVSVLKSVV